MFMSNTNIDKNIFEIFHVVDGRRDKLKIEAKLQAVQMVAYYSETKLELKNFIPESVVNRYSQTT